jgi:hypothetical protein
MSWRPLPDIQECVKRLEFIFPRTAFDTVLSSPLAGWAVAAMIYVDAVVSIAHSAPEDATWARPTTVLWLSEEAYERADPTERAQWTTAQARGRKNVAALLEEWGLHFNPRYTDNSRETLRDEIFPKWMDFGGILVKAGVKTTSPAPRWALTDTFADLFSPESTGDALIDAVDAYREAHMGPGGRVKALVARQRSDRTHAVEVTLPGGTVRQLEPGEASVILRGVIEQWAPARLNDPIVLTISEPGDKVYTADAAVIHQLGLAIDSNTLLPDALLADVGSDPPAFWIIEAVATDGPIDDDRKRALLQWATEQRIPDGSCQFLTAFGSRNAAPAKRRLKDLATGTFAWYADEPLRELAWYEI